MPALMEACPPKRHRWVIVVFGLFVLLLLCVSFIISLFFGIVPQISGTVVNAATGQPVPAMNACLEVRVRDFGKSIALCEARCERAIAPEKFSLRAPFTNLISFSTGSATRSVSPIRVWSCRRLVEQTSSREHLAILDKGKPGTWVRAAVRSIFQWHSSMKLPS